MTKAKQSTKSQAVPALLGMDLAKHSNLSTESMLPDIGASTRR